MEGISNCRKAVSVPFGRQSSSPLTVKPANIPKVPTMLEKRVKSSIPKISEKTLKEFTDSYADLMTEDAWKEKKTRVVALNGFDADAQESIFLLCVFTNVNVPTGATFKVNVQRSAADGSYPTSFAYVSSFNIENNKLVNAKYNTKVSQKEIMACVPAIAPFFYGSALFADKEFVNPSINFIKEHEQEIATALKFDKNEVAAAIAAFKKTGAYDFDTLAKKILKVCLTTPTPVPTPEPEPEPEPEVPEMNFEEEKEKAQPKWYKKKLFGRKKKLAHKKHERI